MARLRGRRRAWVLAGAAVYALLLMVNPVLHDDLAGHLKSPAHCKACTASPTAWRVEGLGTMLPVLADAGSVETQGSTVVASVVLLVDRRLKLGDDPFFSAVVERVQQVCQGEGIRCTLERIDPGDKPVILEDGILAVGMAARRLLERLGRHDVPAVGLFVRARPAPGARVTLLDLDDHRQVAIPAESFEVEPGDPAQPLGRSSHANQRRSSLLDCVAHGALKDGDQQVVLAAEVEVDGAGRDPGDAGHVGDLGLEVAVPGEDLDRGAEDGVALVGHGRRLDGGEAAGGSGAHGDE